MNESQKNPTKQYYENLAKTIIKNLEKRQMEGYYCETTKEAIDKLLSLMPPSSTIGFGGSMTLVETGILDLLKTHDYTLYDRDVATTKEEQKQVYTNIFNSDYFLMSTNAITIQGELINIDNRSNRVSFLCFGPEHVIIIAGMNKVVTDVDSGMKRVRNIASPKNTVRLHKHTPCSNTGVCSDCFSPDCICSQIVVTRFSHIPNRIKVILVGEDLGY